MCTVQENCERVLRYDGGIGCIVNVIRVHIDRTRACEAACGVFVNVSIDGGESDLLNVLWILELMSEYSGPSCDKLQWQGREWKGRGINDTTIPLS